MKFEIAVFWPVIITTVFVAITYKDIALVDTFLIFLMCLSVYFFIRSIRDYFVSSRGKEIDFLTARQTQNEFTTSESFLTFEKNKEARIMYSGFSDNEDLQDFKIEVIRLGYTLTLENNIERAIEIIRARRSKKWHCFFIDIDKLDKSPDIIIVVDFLLRFRKSNPEVPIVLISSDFQRDNFDSYRLPVTDVSLAQPVSFHRLQESLIWAQRNNRIWCNMLASSRVPKNDD